MAIDTADLPHSNQPWNATRRKLMCSSQTKGWELDTEYNTVIETIKTMGYWKVCH
jgi:hypothetical protein